MYFLYVIFVHMPCLYHILIVVGMEQPELGSASSLGISRFVLNFLMNSFCLILPELSLVCKSLPVILQSIDAILAVLIYQMLIVTICMKCL